MASTSGRLWRGRGKQSSGNVAPPPAARLPPPMTLAAGASDEPMEHGKWREATRGGWSAIQLSWQCVLLKAFGCSMAKERRMSSTTCEARAMLPALWRPTARGNVLVDNMGATTGGEQPPHSGEG